MFKKFINAYWNGSTKYDRFEETILVPFGLVVGLAVIVFSMVAMSVMSYVINNPL